MHNPRKSFLTHLTPNTLQTKQQEEEIKKTPNSLEREKQMKLNFYFGKHRRKNIIPPPDRPNRNSIITDLDNLKWQDVIPLNENKQQSVEEKHDEQTNVVSIVHNNDNSKHNLDALIEQRQEEEDKLSSEDENDTNDDEKETNNNKKKKKILIFCIK
ncbi:unnamed protein product [Didymodactylos carnosus]|uniref:Uncharacterized protein n=1 Tax=Didymodactylos carnosus TaxID=1234261 RepID=A0A814JUK4_9BILA|nr:unnamed protein product [Didymodactylos carnosus]CAF1191736.1 unnamed protein product [Didymodactylos carnosus]CAF3812893.1 unnamed protein product [Didymodactylos carnosus]CAF4002217.1 unnamed protein product [Didymodactylos carnosus]